MTEVYQIYYDDSQLPHLLMALPTVHSLYRRFIKSVDDIKNLYQLCGLEDLDENQHTNLKQLTQ